jgi:hypothetical protein
MAQQLQNGLQDSYLSSQGFYKMGCLIFAAIFVYFNFTAYRAFKTLALDVDRYQQST